MCHFTYKTDNEVLNKRELSRSLAQRTEPIVAWKIFKYKRGKLFPVYRTLATSQPNRVITTYGYDYDGPNVDTTGLVPRMYHHGGSKSSKFLRAENGFHSFKYKRSAIEYLKTPGSVLGRSRMPYILRRVLLLDVHGEFNTTNGRVYLSRVLWLFPKKGGQTGGKAGRSYK